MKTTQAKKIKSVIPKAGARGVDPLQGVKQAVVCEASTNSVDFKPAQVDDHNPNRGAFSIVKDAKSGRELSVYLMLADLVHNNNKYYILQALQNKNTKDFGLWVRYGRVGNSGVTNLAHMSSEADVIKNFFKTEKAKNSKG